MLIINLLKPYRHLHDHQSRHLDEIKTRRVREYHVFEDHLKTCFKKLNHLNVIEKYFHKYNRKFHTFFGIIFRT